MTEAAAYKLKLYDQELARFEFSKTTTGFRARGLEVDLACSRLLPLNIAQAPNDVELIRFLESRRIPKGRAYLEEVLRPYGLAPTDTKGIIDLSRGTSINDAYSVVPEADDVPYREYNLFENDFDEVLQIIAYTGVIPRAALGGGKPSDLTPSGAFPKTWRRIGEKLVLYKAGSPVAAPNYGREPYSELLAWQVARAGGFDAVAYDLVEWRGKVCSTCDLFNTPDVAFVPFELCLPIDLMSLCDLDLALSWFSDMGRDSLEAFKSMAVFDSVIANSDRHPGNFGALRDNRTGELLGMAPIFDNNMSLFPRDADEWLDLRLMSNRLAASSGILEAPLDAQGEAMLGKVQRGQLKRLVDFRFADEGFIEEYRTSHPEGCVVSRKRLVALSDFVRMRAETLLER